MKKYRKIKPTEIQIARRLLSAKFPGSTQLLADLDQVENVIEINSSGSIIEFLLKDVSDNRNVQNTLPVEGQYLDEDGELITVLLFVDERERLFQMERFKFSGGVVSERLNLDDFRIIGP